MGLRFRKSIKIAPGLKLNLNKNSVSLTAGTKGVHYTVNSKGKRTASAGIPGTGLYYTQSLSNNKNNKMSAGGNNHKNGGCLMSILKFIGILILIPFAFCFGWIIGIIWLLFFRKRMSDDPDKQKKVTIGVIIYSIISFILTICILCNTSPSIESLKISSDISGDVLDVGKDYEIKISNTPKDSSLGNLKYHISGNGATFKESGSENIAILHTKSEGDVTIYVSSGNVKSNSITFKIVDSTKEELNSDTSDNVVSLPEESEKTESTVNTDSSSINHTEQETSNDVSAAPSNDTTVDDSSTNAVQSNSEPTNNATSDNMVWIDDTAGRYHRTSTCSNMSDPYQVTVDEAIAKNKTACKKCY